MLQDTSKAPICGKSHGNKSDASYGLWETEITNKGILSGFTDFLLQLDLGRGDQRMRNLRVKKCQRVV